MRRIDRRRLLAGLGAGSTLALAGCDTSLEMTEERRPPVEGGIGGTGIVGVLTGFSSLLVNGQRIAFPADTPVLDAYGPAPANALAVGNSLTIEASDGPDDPVARRVVIDHPLVGLLEERSDGRLAVLGTPLAFEPEVAVPRPGQPVAVSGLWRGDAVVVSRIVERPGFSLSAMSGEVSASATPGQLQLGALELLLPAGAAAPEVGSFVTVTGVQRGSRFVVATLRAGRFVGAAGPLLRLSIEGYLDRQSAAPGYRVSGLGHSFGAEARLDAFAGQRALFVGPYDGLFKPDYGARLPEALSERAALLQRVAAGEERLPAR